MCCSDSCSTKSPFRSTSAPAATLAGTMPCLKSLAEIEITAVHPFGASSPGPPAACAAPTRSSRTGLPGPCSGHRQLAGKLPGSRLLSEGFGPAVIGPGGWSSDMRRGGGGTRTRGMQVRNGCLQEPQRTYVKDDGHKGLSERFPQRSETLTCGVKRIVSEALNRWRAHPHHDSMQATTFHFISSHGFPSHLPPALTLF